MLAVSEGDAGAAGIGGRHQGRGAVGGWGGGIRSVWWLVRPLAVAARGSLGKRPPEIKVSAKLFMW